MIGLVTASALLTACGDDGGDDEGAAATTEPELRGDPGSPFCQRSREAADDPVLDPFEAGLEPSQVELRFRALADRFEGFAELAPEPLAEDLARVDARFDRLATLLEDAGYDFEQLARAEVDLSVFDDPELAAVAERLAAYQTQVCRL